jgi:hypothetical protein
LILVFSAFGYVKKFNMSIEVAVVVPVQWLTFCRLSRKNICELAVMGRVAASSRLLPALLRSVRL